MKLQSLPFKDPAPQSLLMRYRTHTNPYASNIVPCLIDRAIEMQYPYRTVARHLQYIAESPMKNVAAISVQYSIEAVLQQYCSKMALRYGIATICLDKPFKTVY